MKNSKGITLIALIITIVVLMIIAVVAIGAIKDGNIIAHAQNAVGDYNAGKEKEEGIIAEYETLINKYGGGGSNSGITTTEEGVPVPAGFKVVEGTKDRGLVIEHETEGSQFVWVPVTKTIDENGYGIGTLEYKEPDILQSAGDVANYYLKLAGVKDKDKDGDVDENDFKIQLENEYKAMARSVNNYKGFYVGRYELSLNNGIAQSRSDGTNIEAVTGAEDSANTWYGLYSLSKTYKTDSVKSSMISGAQYDAMMEWLGDAANIEISERNMTLNPGTAENDVIKNIYDLYGGLRESTIEAYSQYQRVCRGGSNFAGSSSSSGANYPPNTRTEIDPERFKDWLGDYGSRLTLYISVPDDLFNGIDIDNNNDTPEEPEYVEYALWTEPKSTNETIGGETTGSSSNPIIPAGFMPKNTKLSKWDTESGPEADNGLVIVDTEGNEFVWVPVTTSISETGYGLGTEGEREPDIITKYSSNNNASDKILENLLKAGVTDVFQDEGETKEDGIINEYDFKKILEDEYAKMARSVNSNGGYYVGRYEVSIGSDGNAQSKTDGTNIVSATAAEDSANTWYGLYALCKTYNKDSVKSSMISGAQYNAMMEWMGDETLFYNNGYNPTRHPGYVKTDIVKNVYDLYGNSEECTIEASGEYYRVCRGGYFSFYRISI